MLHFYSLHRDRQSQRPFFFIRIGPPTILQPDNGREFSGIASKSLSEGDVIEVIAAAVPLDIVVDIVSCCQ
jgi:hypothetical protein